VVNLRGRIIPILSLRTVFEMEGADYGARASIIVTRMKVESEPITLGLLVDEASEVVRVPLAAIEKPSLLSGNRTFDFIEGIARVDGRIVCLLKLERLLTEVEQTAVRSALELESTPEDGGRDRESEPAEMPG
jgi:purine-binding chemotaxis protein CheW